MTPLVRFYEAEEDLVSSENQIKDILGKLDPNRPQMRVRLVSATTDLIQSSRICFEAFTTCLPFSNHMTYGQNFLDREMTMGQFNELNDLQVRRARNCKLNNDDANRLIELRKKSDAHSDVLRILFGKAGYKLHQDRVNAENKLKTCVRSFIFVCRSYQDTIYSLALVANKKTPSGRSSMAAGLSENGDFKTLLDSPGVYENWFNEFHDLRNLIKEGTTAGVALGGGGASITYDDARNNKHVKVGGKNFSMDSLSTAMKMSAVAVSAVCSPNKR